MARNDIYAAQAMVNQLKISMTIPVPLNVSLDAMVSAARPVGSIEMLLPFASADLCIRLKKRSEVKA